MTKRDATDILFKNRGYMLKVKFARNKLQIKVGYEFDENIYFLRRIEARQMANAILKWCDEVEK